MWWYCLLKPASIHLTPILHGPRARHLRLTNNLPDVVYPETDCIVWFYGWMNGQDGRIFRLLLNLPRRHFYFSCSWGWLDVFFEKLQLLGYGSMTVIGIESPPYATFPLLIILIIFFPPQYECCKPYLQIGQSDIWVCNYTNYDSFCNLAQYHITTTFIQLWNNTWITDMRKV